jgi:pimeloyl-ACP methyl ester carboxylesterase
MRRSPSSSCSIPSSRASSPHGAVSRGTVERLIRQIGSTIDARGLDLYARLLGNPGHVAGTLGMMAGWNLPALERDLPRLATKLVLVACSDDGAVPATDAFAVQEVVPDAEVVFLRHLGHLMHEEKPAMATDIVPQSRRDTRPINTCEKCPVKFTVVSVSLE